MPLLPVNMKDANKIIDLFLKEPDRKKVHHVEFLVPQQVCKLWIIDDAKMMIGEKQQQSKNMGIYFSVSKHSRKGKRIVQTIEMLDIFKGYHSFDDRRNLIYYKSVGRNSGDLLTESTRIIELLFPAIDKKDIKVNILRMDNWMTIEE